MDILSIIKNQLNNFVWNCCDPLLVAFVVRIALMYSLAIIFLQLGARYVRNRTSFSQIIMILLGIATALYTPVEYIRKAGSDFLTWTVILSLLIIFYGTKIIASKLSPHKNTQQIIARLMKIVVLILLVLQMILIFVRRIL